MSDLANYSIETDHTVLLWFQDGRHLRVPLGQLSHYLKPRDLEKIEDPGKMQWRTFQVVTQQEDYSLHGS